jgi:hypothetical protein
MYKQPLTGRFEEVQKRSRTVQRGRLDPCGERSIIEAKLSAPAECDSMSAARPAGNPFEY